MAGVLLCIWSFIGVESASVSSGLVKNPRRNVPLSTMIGTCVAGIVYILSCTAISGMFPAAKMAASGAPFSLAAAHMTDSTWAPRVVSAIIAFACLASLGSWMMLVSQAGVRAAKDGTFPNIFGRINKKGIPVFGLISTSAFMTGLMVILMLISRGGDTQDIFGDIADIAVLLTLPAYFYSALNLLSIHGFRDRRGLLPIVASLGACGFCFAALGGAERYFLAVAIIAMFGVYIFYVGKKRRAI